MFERRLSSRTPSHRRNQQRTCKSALRLTNLENRITPANALLPDMHVLAANLSGWYITTGTGGNRELRFATAMANGGEGAFELRGTGIIVTDSDGQQKEVVNQRIYNDDSTYNDYVAGYFTYHPTHGHVHYDDMANAYLRTRPTANWQDGTIVAVGPKTSFCLIDINHYNPGLPGSPASSKYNSCGTKVQGISVGWNDVYDAGLDGQSINITGVANGNYWLEVNCDAANSVQETNETNNVTRIPITISGEKSYGFRVQIGTPIGAQDGNVDHVDLTFNNPVDETTFTTADITFKTDKSVNIPITSITKLTTQQFRVNFANQTTVGTYTMNVSSDIKNSTGQLLDQNNNGVGGETGDVYNNIFTITAPRVGGQTPTGTTNTALSTLRIFYNKPMDTTTMSMADIVSFTGPGGVDMMSSIASITPATPGPASAAFDVIFTAPLTTSGTYSLLVEPNVNDMLGHSVDQNGDFVTDINDRYAFNVSINIASYYGPDAFGYTARPGTYEPISLTGKAGVFTILAGSDDANTSVNLGTEKFNFYGTNYTGNAQLFVSTNGLITFGVGTSQYGNSNLNSLTSGASGGTIIYPPAIATLWDDWINTGAGSPMVRGLFEDTTGDGKADRLIVEWNKVVQVNAGGSDITFQAVLQLNTGNVPGNIAFNYVDTILNDASYDNGAAATVGIRGSGSTGPVLLVSQNSTNNFIGSGKAISVTVPTVKSITRLDPNPNEDGEVEFQVTFSEGVNGATVDPTDFALTTTGSVTGATVDHLHASLDPAVYTVHVKSYTGTGTIRLDLVDNDSITSLLNAKLAGVNGVTSSGTFTSGEVYNVNQPAPLVVGTNIGDGTSQRSMVRQVQVFYDWPVSYVGAPADAFQLVGPNGAVAVTVDTSSAKVAKLTFLGAGAENGSLMDGHYTLTVLGSKISAGGIALDGDNNGSPGGDFVLTLHRLFGDVDGDGDVDTGDFSFFRTSFGTVEANNQFDFDGDGDVDASDYTAFRARFGVVI